MLASENGNGIIMYEEIHNRAISKVIFVKSLVLVLVWIIIKFPPFTQVNSFNKCK